MAYIRASIAILSRFLSKTKQPCSDDRCLSPHCLRGDASRAGVDGRALLSEGGEALHPVVRADDLWARAVPSFRVALRWFVNFT
jgi:hypothetical protein